MNSRYLSSLFIKVRKEWKKLTDTEYFEKEDIKKICNSIADDILIADIESRIHMLKSINRKVIETSKKEMNHHLEQHNLYKKIIEDYEEI